MLAAGTPVVGYVYLRAIGALSSSAVFALNIYGLPDLSIYKVVEVTPNLGTLQILSG